MKRIKLARFLTRVLDFLPRKYPVNGQLHAQPIFIFGSGRNGSTLLNRILNQHSKLFLPSEQYFIGNSIIKFKLYNWIIWRDLVKIIAGELIPATMSHTWDFNPNSIIKELFLMKERNLQGLLDAIYRGHGERSKSGFQIWGDTTPLNTHYLPEIYHTFPAAKYVFLMRDGRDVVASYKKGGTEYLGEKSNPDKAALGWNEAINKYDWLKKKTPVHLIQYEKLVQDPKNELSKLLDFFDLSFENELLQHDQNMVENPLYHEPQHANLSNPIFTHSIGKWEEFLSENELSLILSSISKNLERFGYK